MTTPREGEVPSLEIFESDAVRINPLDQSGFSFIPNDHRWGWLIQSKVGKIATPSKQFSPLFHNFEGGIDKTVIVLMNDGVTFVYGEGRSESGPMTRQLYDEGIGLLNEHGVEIPPPNPKHAIVEDMIAKQLESEEARILPEDLRPGKVVGVTYVDALDLVGNLSRNAIHVGEIERITRYGHRLRIGVHFKSGAYWIGYETFVPGEKERIINVSIHSGEGDYAPYASVSFYEDWEDPLRIRRGQIFVPSSEMLEELNRLALTSE